MAYTIKRPILLQCNRLPNGGFKPIMSSAKTMKELKIDIVAMTPFSANDLSKFQIVCNTQTLTESSTIPLFSESTGINNEYDERVQSLISNYPNNPKGPEYICISMAETAKNTASGAKTISECCTFIAKAGRVEDFKAQYGCAPEAASLRDLERFINQIVLGSQSKSTTTTLIAATTTDSSIRQQLDALKAENNSLRCENARLMGIIEGYNKARKEYDDDDDEDDDANAWANTAARSTASEISVDPRKLMGV